MTQKKKRPELAPATISEADGVRYLHLGTPWVQGAMRIRKPLAIELEYVQRMMVWMLLRPSESLSEGHAVQLGLGAGSITRYCHGVLGLRTTVVELNDSVIAACRAYFQVEPGRLLKVVEADAGAYAADPATMPPEWRDRLPDSNPDRSRHIADFIAGMTDRYAVSRYRDLVGPIDLPEGF